MALPETVTPLFEPATTTHGPPGPVIGVRDLCKQFPDRRGQRGQGVLRGVNLDVREGEMLVVLGPSGSGKTTLLRIIAGLEHPDTGEVLFGRNPGNHLLPQQRQLGVVFQEQALFQKMTAEQNIAFGLKVRRVRKEVIRKVVQEMLALTKLTEHRHKYPAELSGGQRQRVALARALAYKPEAMLFDEPFSALDPLTRTELRREVRELLHRLNVSAFFITHDQQEALELGDRIAILRDGIIEQVGTPDEIYNQPKSEFIATFLGTANALLGVLREDAAVIGPVRLTLPAPCPFLEGQPIKILFRPEDVVLGLQPVLTDTPYHLGQGLIEDISYFGSTERLVVRVLLRYSVAQVHHSKMKLALVSELPTDDVRITVSRTKWEARENKLSLHDPVIVGLKDYQILPIPSCSPCN
jgi:ABC-type Fe3+/spermidine/putrescine transport system ATPase subunit